MVPKTVKGKVVFIGDSGVGKTSLILRHDGRAYTSNYSATLGANFIVSTIRIGGDYVELQLWDTAGQERFRSMVPMYMRNAKAAFLVYDITDRFSYDHLQKWVEDISRWCNDSMKLIVLGNKRDLERVRVVKEEEARQFAENNNAMYFETSALNDTGIEQAMRFLAEELILDAERQQLQINKNKNNSTVDIDQQQQKPSNFGCC